MMTLTSLAYSNGSDFCNVLSAKAITEGRHSFEFVVHKVGDNMMCGVTCRKNLAGTQTSLVREAKCWTYYSRHPLLLFPPKTSIRSYSAQIRSQNEEKNHTPQTVPALTDENQT